MTANINPIFVITPKVGMVSISTANTNRDGTGTLGSVITGGANGTRVDRVVIQATGTTTSGMVRLFIFDGSSVTSLWKEIPVSAATPSGTVQAFRAVISADDATAPLLVLPSNYVLKASTHNAESFVVSAVPAGDY